MKDTLLTIKEKLNEIIQESHRTGYDFNADPANVTLLEGEIFEALDKLIASQPPVEAEAKWCGSAGCPNNPGNFGTDDLCNCKRTA